LSAGAAGLARAQQAIVLTHATGDGDVEVDACPAVVAAHTGSSPETSVAERVAWTTSSPRDAPGRPKMWATLSVGPPPSVGDWPAADRRRAALARATRSTPIA